MICHPCRVAADNGTVHYHCLAGIPDKNESVLTRQQRESLCTCQHRPPKGSTADDDTAVPSEQPVPRTTRQKGTKAKASTRASSRVRPLEDGTAEAGIRIR